MCDACFCLICRFLLKVNTSCGSCVMTSIILSLNMWFINHFIKETYYMILNKKNVFWIQYCIIISVNEHRMHNNFRVNGSLLLKVSQKLLFGLILCWYRFSLSHYCRRSETTLLPRNGYHAPTEIRRAGRKELENSSVLSWQQFPRFQSL